MHKKVGAFTTLFLAIAAAMATASVSAEAASGVLTKGAAPLAQDQSGAADQTAPQDTNTKKENRAQATQLGTVIVTANRRTETLQNVAAPVSVVSYQELQRQHLQSFADYAASVPGLNVVSGGPGQAELSIRGIASGSQQASASVGIYIDDTPFGSSSVFVAGASLTPDLDPADMQRIEVLRGPQGTLYGAGALGGVLRFITIPPNTQSIEGRVELGGNSISGGGNGFSVRGMLNLPLVADKLAVRVNVFDRTDPGFVDDAGLGKKDVNESRVKGARLSLLWTPTDKTSLRLTSMAQNLTSEGTPSVALDPTTLKPVYGDLQQRGAALGGPGQGRYRLYNATLSSDFGWSKLIVSSSYSTLDAMVNLDVTPLLFLGYQANGQPYGTLEQEPIRQTKATQEIRLESPKSQTVEWLAGVFFTNETGNAPQHIYASDYYTGTPLPSPFGIAIGDDTQPSSYNAYAAYGSLTWHFTDRFSVEAGLRYSHDRQHYIESGSGLLFGSPTPVVLVDKKSADSSTTFSLTPKWQVTDTTLLYARVASGFLPGGPNVVPVGTPDVPKTFSPTQLTDYELGLKSTSLDDRLMVDISAYYIDWTKIPLVTFENNFTFLTSGGQAQSKGVEATVQFMPVRGLKLSANVAYSNATLTKDAPAPSNGMKGDPLPYAPKLTYSFNGDYDFALGGDWRGYVGAGYQYIDTRTTDFAFTGVPSPTIPAYHTVNLRAGVDSGPWNIGVYVKNLTDERGIVYGANAGQLNAVTGETEDNAIIITPRMFGISVSRDF
ncbi:MAG TPA: TonB-dependent receptor [Rhodanobacter sp.]|nr:TonB-dependent receptor [Rhodanobacter sp.]